MKVSVRKEGIGPSTSVLSGQRSTTELLAHIKLKLFLYTTIADYFFNIVTTL